MPRRPVLRPALRCVTCRTLINVFDQDRSIIFCKDRTVAQSCSRVALKILRRNLATFCSWTRQSTASQSRTSSGPFTVTVSNLSFRSQGLDRQQCSKAHLPTSAPFRAQPSRLGIRPVMSRRSAEGRPRRRGFPVVFRPPAFACWASCSRRGLPPLLTVGLPGERRSIRPDPDGVSTFRTPESRPDWVPYLPRDHAVLNRPVRSLRPSRAPSSRGQVLSPRSTSHLPKLSITGRRQRFTRVHPPGLLPGPVIPGWNKDSLGHTPRAPHPADQEPAAHAEAGDGHRALARSYHTTDIAAPPIQQLTR